ncbi:MAG: GlmL-related ornithine degradation protein [Clostridia bacterium]|nr:GlmL-related ornithine degradation protein [Clostridia bacterium]
MHVNVLVAEIGSTTTIVNAFDGLGSTSPRFVAQGKAPTTVLDGDVRIGLKNAVDDLLSHTGEHTLTYDRMLASGSAAGGLRMTVHGLVRDMTVRAAEAAALGAGAIIVQTTAGKMNEFDLDDLDAARPNLILLAGGTDYGERETAVYNMRAIAGSGRKTPVIYCGNVQNRTIVSRIAEENGIPLSIADNVYPRLDELNVESVRKVIHAMFEKHIVNAPGMEHIRDMVNGSILPTPGSVMLASQLLYDEIGDLAVIDIGGATTDVHSVTDGSPDIVSMMTSPEPKAKRTVEGDLGLYINAHNLVDRLGTEALNKELGIDTDAVMKAYKPIPETETQFRLTERLCLEAGLVALDRHAGKLRHLYTPQGRRTIAEGKDLTAIRWIVGTGGALTRLPHHESILRTIADCNKNRMQLLPTPGTAKVLFDNDYIMASVGVLSKEDPESALRLLKESIRWNEIRN